MKAIEFYKFIHDNKIEWHWLENLESREQDVIIFPSYSEIQDLGKILSPYHFDDEGIKCIMKQGYFAIWANDILYQDDIELTEIFPQLETLNSKR